MVWWMLITDYDNEISLQPKRALGWKVGKTEDYVAQQVRLLGLPDRIRQMLSRDEILPSAAEALAQAPKRFRILLSQT